MYQTRKALLASLLVAVAVSLGFALSAVPNVELLTLSVFLSGFLVGPLLGALVGAVSAVLFSLFNPLGAALPPLMAAQGLGQAIVGLSGGIAGPAMLRIPGRVPAMVSAGGVGLVLTLLYDVLTNAGGYVTIAGERSMDGLVKFVVAGILFLGLHIVWNTVVFSAALMPVLRVLDRYREELKTG